MAVFQTLKAEDLSKQNTMAVFQTLEAEDLSKQHATLQAHFS